MLPGSVFIRARWEDMMMVVMLSKGAANRRQLVSSAEQVFSVTERGFFHGRPQHGRVGNTLLGGPRGWSILCMFFQPLPPPRCRDPGGPLVTDLFRVLGGVKGSGCFSTKEGSKTCS